MYIRKPEENSLRLEDLDDVEMIMCLEETFDIKFSDASVSQCQNVGELFQYFKQLFPPDKKPGKCITSMAFYRLRSALKSAGVTVPVTPKTPMTTLSDLLPYEFEKSVNKHMTNYGVSLATSSRWGDYGMYCIIWSAFFGFLSFGFWWYESINSGLFWFIIGFILTSLISIGIFLCHRDQGRYCDVTVGECAEYFALNNFFILGKEGGDMREATLWKFFCWIITQQIGIDPKKINMDTVFS